MTAKKTDALQTVDSTDMTRPDFLPTGATGTEHITNADMQIPRILLAQKMSPEVDDAEPVKRIEGLKVGDMFNGLTHEIYGRGPLDFVILRADPPRFVEFIPRAEGGGIKDPNVPAHDPRTQFGKNGEKPAATKFYDYIVLLMPLGTDPAERMVALSFKSTGLKIAKQLNALIKLRNAPIFSGVYRLSSADTQNSKGKFAIYQVTNAGWVRDKNLADSLEHLSNAIRDKEIAIDREPGEDDGDTDFPPVDAPPIDGVSSM